MPTTIPPGFPAWSRARRIGHYGGATDKRNSATEGDTPYAYTWYRELQAGRGSAYRQDFAGLVHAENLAIARQAQAVTRAAEKLEKNSVPGTSDEKLPMWIVALGIPQQTGDTKHDIRQRAAAKYRSTLGPTIQNEDETIAQLLGDNFVKVFRQEGASLSAPPTQTFWPGVNPGPVAYSLGGGAWLSERANLVVEVKRLAGQKLSDYLQLINVQLFHLLDRMLPAWATFNAAEGVTSGFVLDVAQLDFTGMTP